ncbi:hypothetical protein J0A68_13720 [Algoriphagus sp. H41]|uniref:Lipoprotein n=1 Tax=Algoriphagus oliviformis TaxID=2811231 RepID=A0ABS3C790_9BACT|nr:hypothetical protein [Algoriphagus oliviformis]MBN7812005.1 hypothetical protein [Algoriphagus oliviformis]
MLFIKPKNIALAALAIFAFGCSLEDTSLTPDIPWIDKEGTAKAVDVFLDFQGMQYKSATEIHSYNGRLKNRVVDGTFEVYNFGVEGEPVSHAKGEIICIAFAEDCKTARITGVITSGSDPTYPGYYAIWTVVDDGMGINETTDIRYPIDEATANYHCEVGVSLEWYNFEKYFDCGGKAQVRPSECK